MKYSHNYKKLNRESYTTIRRYNNGYKVGDEIFEIYPNGKHKVRITKIRRDTINNIAFQTLFLDTDCLTREDVRRLFQSFYGKEIDFDKEKFFIFYMEKI